MEWYDVVNIEHVKLVGAQEDEDCEEGVDNCGDKLGEAVAI